MRKASARAPVDHPHRLALAARDLAGRDELDGHVDAGVLAQGASDPGAEGHAVGAGGGGRPTGTAGGEGHTAQAPQQEPAAP